VHVQRGHPTFDNPRSRADRGKYLSRTQPAGGWQRVSAALSSRKPSSQRPAPSKNGRRIPCMAISFCPAIPRCRSSMKSTGSGREKLHHAALQRDPTWRAIFSLSASFQIEEPGLEHAVTMPKVPLPEDLPKRIRNPEALWCSMPDSIRRWFAQDRPIEIRPVDLSRYVQHETGALEQYVWRCARRGRSRAIPPFIAPCSLIFPT